MFGRSVHIKKNAKEKNNIKSNLKAKATIF
jgi:hypothetical protein